VVHACGVAEGVLERNQGQRPDGKRDSSEEILGRYALLTQIAEGELATVHLARQHGDAGFQRLVAIKRLKPLFARQPECVQLLLDEARLTSDLHHANVVGCLDMGTEGGCYVVQNYVEGDSLQGLLKAAGAETHARYVVPLIVDVLNGLHAVHTALDDEGVPLSLVHQAPRARHVLVGIDGTARLCDFTQAKARGLVPSRQRADRMKIAYMAPEQALNPDAVDHRADLFLVGVMLWEALTGQRLFAADSDELTFQHLLHRRVLKPSEVGLRPPRCFDAIVLRALEREPDKRFRSSLDMARELRDTALNHALYATTGEIGQWVKGLAGSTLVERRRVVGTDTGSHEVPLEAPSSSSGFYQATKVADPYGSGLIFGGSFSRLDPSAPLDPDKTPAIGNRISAPPPRRDRQPVSVEAYRERDDEPTGKVTTPGGLRERKITEPYWQPTRDSAAEVVVPVAAATPARVPATAAPASALATPAARPGAMPVAAPAVAAAKPPVISSDEELTRPSGFAPAKAGAPRTPGTVSPGAYSQVAVERKSRPSAPQPATVGRASTPTSAPTAAAQAPALTSPAKAPASMPPLGASLSSVSPAVSGMALRPTAPLAPVQRSALGATKPKSKAAVDAPSTADVRTDSTPQRLLVPSTPVGSPYRDASPSKAPASFELPPMPRALGELSGRTRPADVLRVPVDSLSPPNSAARTVPPPTLDEPEPRANRTIWIVTAVLAAVILLAVGVSVQRMREVREPQRVTAAQPVAPSVVPASPTEPPAEPLAEPPLEAAEQAATPAPAPAIPSAGAEPTPSDAPSLGAPTRTGKRPSSPAGVRPGVLGARPGPVGAKPSAIPAAEKAAESQPEAPAEAPVAAPPKPAKRVRGPLPIPDNPY